RRHLLTSATCGLMVSLLVYRWTAELGSYLHEEGYREVSSAALADADDSVTFCAIGGSRTVWEYYFPGKLWKPLSVSEFLDGSRRYREVRCLYYPASWQDEKQTG